MQKHVKTNHTVLYNRKHTPEACVNVHRLCTLTQCGLRRVFTVIKFSVFRMLIATSQGES